MEWGEYLDCGHGPRPESRPVWECGEPTLRAAAANFRGACASATVIAGLAICGGASKALGGSAASDGVHCWSIQVAEGYLLDGKFLEFLHCDLLWVRGLT